MENRRKENSPSLAAPTSVPSLADQDERFSCNVCLDVVKDPVVTQCGHLYCWPCLYRWLKTHHTTCPVCKSGVTQENVIPIYIRGVEHDPRLKAMDGSEVPNRPQGHRIDATEVHLNQNGGNGNIPTFGGNMMTSSYGFFPSLFGLQFQSFAPTTRAATTEETHPMYLSVTMYVLMGTVLLCLVFF